MKTAFLRERGASAGPLYYSHFARTSPAWTSVSVVARGDKMCKVNANDCNGECEAAMRLFVKLLEALVRRGYAAVKSSAAASVRCIPAPELVKPDVGFVDDVDAEKRHKVDLTAIQRAAGDVVTQSIALDVAEVEQPDGELRPVVVVQPSELTRLR